MPEHLPYSFFTPQVEVSSAGVAVGYCGRGRTYQANIQYTPNPSFVLFETKGEPADSPLTKLAEDTNKFFSTRANQLLLQTRKEVGIPKLEITVHLTDRGMRLVYDYPGRKPNGRGAPAPQWVLGGRFWLWLSRVVYPLLHWRRPRIPDSEREAPQPQKARSPSAARRGRPGSA